MSSYPNRRVLAILEHHVVLSQQLVLSRGGAGICLRLAMPLTLYTYSIWMLLPQLAKYPSMIPR